MQSQHNASDGSDPFDKDTSQRNPFGDDEDDPFSEDFDDLDDGLGGGLGGEPTSDSKFCVACGTMTTVTNGEVRYCGECGRELYSPPTHFPDFDDEDDFDIGLDKDIDVDDPLDIGIDDDDYSL